MDPPRFPRIGWGLVTSPFGLRLIVGTVEAGGGEAGSVAFVDDAADVVYEGAGAAVPSPARRRMHTQEVRLIILTNEYLRST